jgi:hypothetical protein
MPEMRPELKAPGMGYIPGPLAGHHSIDTQATATGPCNWQKALADGRVAVSIHTCISTSTSTTQVTRRSEHVAVAAVAENFTREHRWRIKAKKKKSLTQD